MAEITVSDIRFHDLSDYETYMAFPFSEISLSSAPDVATLKMVSGRLVSVRLPGSQQMWSVTLPYSTRADIDWLRGKLGDTFLIRTTHGEVFFAALQNIQMDEQKQVGIEHDSPVGSVSFNLSEVSLTVEV